MKTPPFSHPQASSRRGVALVIVLAFLVLLSTLIIAFFSSVQTEAQSAQGYSQSVAVKQIVESANQVFMGQLSDGTKSLQVPGDSASKHVAWASQPGMIRTWDEDGKIWKIFKLYSAKQMVLGATDSALSGGGYSNSAELKNEVPDDWPKQTSLYTDLNAPVLVAKTGGPIDRKDGRLYYAEYPIVNPQAFAGANKVEGFELQAPPGYESGTLDLTASKNPTTTTAAGKTANPVPMPVAWIYVLKDGKLTSPSSTTNNGRTAQFPAGAQPTKANPIVGRFAFWGDDESCKLNVNTASEPTPWDTPRAASLKDIKYGKNQPLNKEFQRYPGHPAMTALSPVFLPGRTFLDTVAKDVADKELIYKLSPRVRVGGSKSGTIAISASATTMPDDADRLFASMDEFVFDTTRKSVALTGIIDTERLKLARFFLTANSRAPEVNLSGGPRISLWPESSTGTRTAFDKLAAFCSTLGPAAANNTNIYYFQRGASGTSTGANSPTSDYTSINRNKQLYKYLQNITGDTVTKVPGFGGSLKNSWSTDRDQVLTEIFDYIRCINLSDNQVGAAIFAPTKGQVVPIEINATRGFGRIHTISQFGIQFICSQDDVKRTAPVVTTALAAGERKVEAAILFSPFCPSMGWFNLLEDLSVEVKVDKDVTIGGKVLFPAGFKKVISLNDSNSGGYHLNSRQRGGTLGFRGIVSKNGGGTYSLISTPVTLTGVTAAQPTMDFKGMDLTVKIFNGPGGTGTLLQTISVSMPEATLPAPNLVLSGTLGYNNGGAAGPTNADYWWKFSTRFSNLGAHPLAPGAEYKDPNRRWGTWTEAPGFKTSCMFRAEDVVRSVVPNHGDLRLLAAKKTIDKSLFVPIGDSYKDPKIHFSHIFAEISGPHLIYGFGNEPTGTQIAADAAADQPDKSNGTIAVAQPGDQLTAAKYHWSHLPEIRPKAGKEFNKFGDFDNGIAQSTDGAYINKPDEGNQSEAGGHWPYFNWSYDPLNVGYFSPNRLVSSAGMLGSLPTGVLQDKPWQTLLFRPQKGHPGDVSNGAYDAKSYPKNKAPDHLVMDLFWMPVVEPYAISEPFSTAGKINMNYEIAPFSYIKRATGLYGVMKSEEPLAVPNDAADVYKIADHETASNLLPDEEGARGCVDPAVKAKWIKYVRSGNPTMRSLIDIPETLTQFDKRFADGEIFRSATQICEMHLVSKGAKLSDYEQTVKVNGQDIPKFWDEHVVTGENARERPYANLYARLTTKSNVFTVHIRAQVLRKSQTSNAAEWNEDTDRQMSEYRGSTIVERYIDPAQSNPSLPDFAVDSTATVDDFYRFRVVSTKKFAP